MSRLPARRARFQRRVIDRRALHRGAEWFPARAESRGAELYARSKLAYKLIEHLSTWFRRPRAAAALDAQALEVVERRSSEHVVHAPRECAFARARRSRRVVE